MQGYRLSSGRTGWNLLVRVQLLEQAHSIIHHVRPLGELILCRLDLLHGEELIFDKMGEEGENEMAIAVWYDCLCQVVVGHGEFEGRDRLLSLRTCKS